VSCALAAACANPAASNTADSSSPTPTPTAPTSAPSSQSQSALIGHTWELNDITACPGTWGLSAAMEGTGITRRTFTFQPDGTIAGYEKKSPPDPNSSGTFTKTYVLNGSSLVTREDSYSVGNWTVENLTDSSFTLD
jgi:hypothetical protein